MNGVSKFISATRLAVALVVLGSGGGLNAPLQAQPSAAMDALERSLETDRHQGLLARIHRSDATLSDFTSDGCSGGLSSAWAEFSQRFPEFALVHGQRPPWEACCVSHDRHYHAGGANAATASDSFDSRKQADLELMNCVAETGMSRSAALRDIYGLTEVQVKVLYRGVAESMYRAVRLGGIPCTDLPWRWGYGWPLCESDPVDPKHSQD